VPLSPGTVAAVTARVAGKLDGFLERVRANIAASDVAGFDETGFRVAGRLHCVHCARTAKYPLLVTHLWRGRKAMEAMGVLASFGGVAVHDAWALYDTYSSADHQLCCAHALRELQAVIDGAPEGEWCWAAQAADALTTMQALASEAIAQGRDAVDPARAGRADPQLSLRCPARCPPDRGPQRQADEKTPCPGLPPARPP
jgi:transposase